jgi:hypothetical protein
MQIPPSGEPDESRCFDNDVLQRHPAEGWHGHGAAAAEQSLGRRLGDSWRSHLHARDGVPIEDGSIQVRP